MRHVTLKSGDKVPVLGVGTWRMGERKGERAAEVAAIKLALDLGIRLVDTAEMYGEGGAEEMLAEALAGRRDEIFLVSKVYPQNASRKGVLAACERSLKRLKTDRLDLYLLHWPGSTPIEETIGAFETLRKDGKIRNWGVSNFDAGGMDGVARAPNGEQLRLEPGALSPRQPRHRMAAAGRLPQGRRDGYGVLAAGPGPPPAQAGAEGGRGQARRGACGHRAGVGAAASGCDHDPEGREAGARAGQHGGARREARCGGPEGARFSLSAAEAGRTAGHDLAGVAGSQPGTSPKNDKREERGVNWFNGMEAILGVAVLAVVWVVLRLLQRRASAGGASALGMALVPVTVLLVMVGGVVLILNGVGLM